MPVIPRLASLAAVAEQSSTQDHFSFGLRDFLDGFYADPKQERLNEEPRPLTNVLHDKGYADAFLAGAAEHLASQFRLAVPAWCGKPHRFLPLPQFAFKTDEGRMFLIVESPAAFRVRNIFITADALSRV